jgi:hypothetical protein
MNKPDYKTQEYNWSVIENKVSPYSLVQNNNAYPVPLWAKVGAIIGLGLLAFSMVFSLL